MTFKDFNKNNRLVVGLLIILILVGLLVLRSKHDSAPASQPSQNTVRISIAPSGIKYPFGWEEASTITSADKTAGVLSEAGRNKPSAQAVVRVDEAPLANNFDIQKTAADTANKLKDNLSNFVLVNQEVTKLGNYQAIHIIYKDSNDGQVLEHAQFIVPTKNRSFYLVITAKEPDFQAISHDINTLANNYADYIAHT